ncbi:MAG TPA: YIP1 family protein [Terriglobales bacterium]|nr:YIP1 family protein [Terriglobales bacterium]
MATTVPPSPEPALSEGQRLIDVFIAPSKTFTDLRRNASWWAPFLIIVIISAIFSYVVDQKVGFRKVVDNQIQQQPKAAERLDQMPAAQREKALERQVSITKAVTYVVPLIGLIVYAIFAGVLLATIKVVTNAEVAFGALFALIVYTRLPEVVRAALVILSLLAGVSSDSFDIKNPVATNPAYFLDPTGSPVLRAVLSSLDVITIWTLVLTAIGVACVAKVKRGTAFAIVFGWFGVVVLFRIGIAAIFS